MEGPSHRFFCGAMLGRLATWLRVLGMDVEYERDIDDAILIRRAISEDRLVLTRDTRLIKRRLLRGRFFSVHSDHVEEQIIEVTRRFRPLAGRFLSRCLRCNLPLSALARGSAESRVPPYVFKTERSFSTCRGCGRIYWPGTQRKKMEEVIERIMQAGDEGCLISFVTVAGLEEARSIADTVVSEGLAACCNIVPAVESIYRWKGKIEHESEVLCIFKTTRGLFERFKERVLELHSYEVPEVVAVDITAGSEGYLKWLRQACGGAETS